MKRLAIAALAASTLTGCADALYTVGAGNLPMAVLAPALTTGASSAVAMAGGIASQTTEETSSETSDIENRIYYMVTGQPAVCPEQMECPDGVDMVALTIARRNPDPRYLMLAEGVAMCDAGKLPAPPLEEQYCGEYQAFKLKIDRRADELKASGKV